MKNSFGAALACGALASALGAGPAAASCIPVPRFDSPSVAGLVSGIPVTAVYEYSGGNGGAFGVDAYWLTSGGNGALTAHKKIAAVQGGDRMTALFANGKLYVANAIYLSGEPHCCYTHVAVQRFKMNLSDADHPQLVADGSGTVAQPKEPSFQGTCQGDTEDSRYRDYFNGSWRRAVISAVR